MPKYLITLPPQPLEKVKAAWAKVVGSSGGSGLSMDHAYLDTTKAQAICCWNAPNISSVQDLFKKAGVTTESIREVEEYFAKAA